MKGRKHVFYSAFSFSASWKADVMAGASATMSGHGIVVNCWCESLSKARRLGLQSLYGITTPAQDCQRLFLFYIREKYSLIFSKILLLFSVGYNPKTCSHCWLHALFIYKWLLYNYTHFLLYNDFGFQIYFRFYFLKTMLVHSKIELQVQGSHITLTPCSSSVTINTLHSILLQSLKQHWHIISKKICSLLCMTL